MARPRIHPDERLVPMTVRVREKTLAQLRDIIASPHNPRDHTGASLDLNAHIRAALDEYVVRLEVQLQMESDTHEQLTYEPPPYKL